jgi:23S rRNA pseudouridine2605 synthase
MRFCDTQLRMSAQVSAPISTQGDRIAKFLSRHGVASRRSVEAMIAEGRVAVNGETVTHPATFVTAADNIVVDGHVVGAKEAARLWQFHKPKGVMVSEHDPEGRPTIYDVLPPDMPRVMPIGRLDYQTEGLLLLTNSGALKRHLELPATGWLRRYRVRVQGEWHNDIPERLAAGITVEGIKFGTINVVVEPRQKANARLLWLDVSLREGKNREVRRAMQHMGLHVNRLIRVSYGPFSIGELKEGELREVNKKVLSEQIGRILAEL